MDESVMEALLSSPPEREELVVQLFVRDNGQWAEVFREQGVYWIEVYRSGSGPMRFQLDRFIQSLERSRTELQQRLEC